MTHSTTFHHLTGPDPTILYLAAADVNPITAQVSNLLVRGPDGSFITPNEILTLIASDYLRRSLGLADLDVGSES